MYALSRLSLLASRDTSLAYPLRGNVLDRKIICLNFWLLLCSYWSPIDALHNPRIITPRTIDRKLRIVAEKPLTRVNSVTAPTTAMEEEDCKKRQRRTALVIIDMSVEQMSAVRHNAREVTENCRLLASNDSNFFDLCIDCRLWLTSPEESSLSWVYPDETARTMFVAGSEGASVVPELRDIPGLVFVEKNNYSCFANSDLMSTLRRHDITDVYLCGINTDYCVFATAMASFEAMLRTYVVEDAVTSYRGEAAHVEGLENLRRHFGPSSLVRTREIVAKSSSSSS